MEMKVVAIDPGTHTGIAWGEYRRNAEGRGIVASWVKHKFGVEQVNCPDEVEGLLRIWMVLDREEPDVLIIEDFVLLPPDAMKKKGGWSSARSGLSPTRLAFGLKLLLYLKGVDEEIGWASGVKVVWQMPSMMGGVTEAELRRMGLWKTPTQIPGSKPGDGPHAMDALRHLLVWGKKQGGRS
jgi:hypothetical protein